MEYNTYKAFCEAYANLGGQHCGYSEEEIREGLATIMTVWGVPFTEEELELYINENVMEE